MSEGTNRERLQQNNIKLEEIKTQVQNLPEYQDIQPMYNVGDYTLKTLPYPPDVSSGNISQCYKYENYYLACWRTASSSYPTKFYLYNLVDNEFIYIGKTSISGNSSSTSSLSILGIRNNNLYILRGSGSNNEGCDAYTVSTLDATTNNISDNAPYEALHNMVWSDNKYVATTRIGTGKLFTYTLTDSSINLSYTGNAFYGEIMLNRYLGIGMYSNPKGITRVYPNIVSKTLTQNIIGVNFAGTKIFLNDGIYELSVGLNVGSKICDYNIKPSQSLVCLNDKYYVTYYAGVLYSFDDETNEFKVESSFTNYTKAGYECSSEFCTNNNVMMFEKGINITGYKYNGDILIPSAAPSANTSKILIGTSIYSDGILLEGTMPNNGALNYTPSTEQQTIPAGYTSGGKVAGDTNLTSNNIKLGVSIFGVEGNLEPDKPDQTKSVTPTTEEQVITPDTGYELASVTVEAVTNSIDSNIVAENIKKDVNILGVTGTYEGSGGGTVEGIKQFSTVEEMQADITSQEGDLAIVYRDEIQNCKIDSEFSKCMFPETVVLPSSITTSISINFKTTDNSKMFDCWGNLDSSNFNMECYLDSGDFSVSYSSSDGITYTRSSMSGSGVTISGNEVDFGMKIICRSSSYWNDDIGYFIQINGNTFEGLYECALTDIPDTHIINGKTYHIPNFDKNLFGRRYDEACLILNAISGKEVTDYVLYHLLDSGANFYLDNETLSLSYTGTVVPTDIDKTHYINGEQTTENISIPKATSSSPSTVTLSEVYDGEKTSFINCNLYTNKSANTILVNADESFSVVKKPVYNYANTQLTLDNTSQLLPGKIGYGKNGIVEGDDSIMTPDNTFADTPAMIYTSVLNAYENMEPKVLTDRKRINTGTYVVPVKTDGTPLIDISNVTNAYQMFMGCSKLKSIPLLDTRNLIYMSYMFNGCTNLISVPQFNTSNVTEMNSTFRGCSNLITLPVLDTSKVTSINVAFQDCPLLSDESLNNILLMCINMTSYTDTKNLVEVGLSSAQATKCTTLSNYQAFLDAGWTTGY